MRKNHKTPFSRFKELMKRDVRNKYILTAFCVALIITCFRLLDSPIEDKVFALLNALGFEGYWAECVYIIFEVVGCYIYGTCDCRMDRREDMREKKREIASMKSGFVWHS